MSAKQHTMEVEMTDNNSGARSFSDQISALQTEVMKKSSMRLVGSQQSTMADLNDMDKKIEESTDSDSDHAHDAVNWTESLTWSLLVIQITFIILFGIFCKYSTELDGRDDLTTPEDQVKSFSSVYPMFQDVHIMMFIGFGYLMTFLRRYSYSAVGFNFVIAAIAIQWSMLTRDFFEQCWNSAFHKIELNVASMVNGDFCAAAVLISFGAVLGKTSLVQLVWMVIMEVVFYSVNEALIVKQFQAADVGGSMIIHTFGAYFGLTVSRMLASSHSLARKQDDNRAVYHSDVFAMIGTIFLWCYWPSFNGALAGFDSNAQPRTTLNTYLSLAACCLIAFAVSKLLRGGKLDMVDIQNATLAGGVAIGASANFMLRPWAALFVGTIAGFLSSFGFARVMKFLSDKIGLHDTCGVHNLHGMPGVLGGLVSIIATAAIEDHDYGNHIGAVYPARLDGRSHSAQAWFQLAALLSSIGIGIGGGIIVGFVLRSPLFEQPRTPFSDHVEWITPSEEVTFFDSKRQFQLKERKSAKSLKTSSSEDAMV